MKYYDKYLVAFSGGKDSLACLLYLLEIGIPKSRIELWHHDVDGGSETFMDWECTPSYCRAIAAHFQIPIYFSWKQGGFKSEMLRYNQRTAPTVFENQNHQLVRIGGSRGKKSTRLKFPQVSSDLSTRWCSSYLKIDVCATAIRNQQRFTGIRTLVISGERAEESTARSKYADFEIDRADLRNGEKPRHVDRWRPIKTWTEKMVWEIIGRWKIRPHPAYVLGWGRVSCKFCIFGNANQFASAYSISPKQGEEIIFFEESFGCTIKRDISLRKLIDKGTPYKSISKEIAHIATSTKYDLPIVMDTWQLPAGAFGESCGPQ
jgi:3'-phosphoadenosine 5'-phosphosulfate sulfotransferase (PAPS reductase)/FAD synthetase